MKIGDDVVDGALDALDAALDTVAELNLNRLSAGQRVAVLDRLEHHARRLPTLERSVLAGLTAETTPTELGVKSWRDVLSATLRISRSDAGRRLGEAEQLGPRTAITGAALAPLLAETAAAAADGAIGAEHIQLIRKAMAALPHWVDAHTRQRFDADLVTAARANTPDVLKDVAHRLLALIDPDGPEPDDAERARRRGLWIGPQGRDGLTPFRGLLNPEALATWQPALAKLSAPGMCNPDDPEPRISGTPSALHRRRLRQPSPPHPRVDQEQRPHQHRRTHPGLRPRQPPRRTRLDRRHRQRHRPLDPTTRPRHRPNPHQRLPPPRTTTHTTRRRTQ